MDAKIENFNVTEYSSVLPPESNEIPIDDAVGTFHHGAVIETIMASVNGVKGNTLATGVGRIQVRRKSDGRHIGGFAAEYEKVHQEEITLADAEKAANDLLHTSLVALGWISYIYPEEPAVVDYRCVNGNKARPNAPRRALHILL